MLVTFLPSVYSIFTKKSEAIIQAVQANGHQYPLLFFHHKCGEVICYTWGRSFHMGSGFSFLPLSHPHLGFSRVLVSWKSCLSSFSDLNCFFSNNIVSIFLSLSNLKNKLTPSYSNHSLSTVLTIASIGKHFEKMA